MQPPARTRRSVWVFLSLDRLTGVAMIYRLETHSTDPLSLRERVGVRVKGKNTYPSSP